jgi:hypothetical protein
MIDLAALLAVSVNDAGRSTPSSTSRFCLKRTPRVPRWLGPDSGVGGHLSSSGFDMMLRRWLQALRFARASGWKGAEPRLSVRGNEAAREAQG